MATCWVCEKEVTRGEGAIYIGNGYHRCEDHTYEEMQVADKKRKSKREEIRKLMNMSILEFMGFVHPKQ